MTEVDKLIEREKVTPEMADAWVRYEPPGQFKEVMSFHTFNAQLKVAFYSGWVAAEERSAQSLEQAVLAEREACAKIAEDIGRHSTDGEDIAAAIRNSAGEGKGD